MTKNLASCKMHAVNAYSDLLSHSTVIYGVHRYWRNKWKGTPTVDRPTTVLSALDHRTTNANLSLLLQLLATVF